MVGSPVGHQPSNSSQSPHFFAYYWIYFDTVCNVKNSLYKQIPESASIGRVQRPSYYLIGFPVVLYDAWEFP